MLKCQFNDFELNCSQIMLVHRPSETPRLTIYPIGEGEENNDALFVNAVKHFKQLKAEDEILVVEDKETFTYTGYILEKAVFEIKSVSADGDAGNFIEAKAPMTFELKRPEV